MPAISAGALKRMLHPPADVVAGTPRIETDRNGDDVVIVPTRQMRGAWPPVRPSGRTPLASPRHRLHEAAAGARARARDVRGAWGDRRDGAVGEKEKRVHARLRTAGRLAGRACAAQRHEQPDARRPEERGPDPQARRRRSSRRTGRGPVRRVAFHWRGRDQPQEGSHVHDRGHRPRPGARHPDARRARREGLRPVLPDAHARPARLHRGGHRQRGAMDRRVRVPPAPADRTHPRRLPHRRPGRRRARQGQDRSAWRETRRSGTARKGVRDPIKGARWALLKNESDLNAAQRARLEYIANTNETLWTAYKLKERLGMILRQGRGCGRAPAAPVGRGRILVRHRGILKTRREDRTAPLRHPIRPEILRIL